jgi:hypothetical protein
LIADNVVLSMLNKQQLKPQDFAESLGAYSLTDTARKAFLQAFDSKLNDEFKHPVFDVPLLLQASDRTSGSTAQPSPSGGCALQTLELAMSTLFYLIIYDLTDTKAANKRRTRLHNALWLR